MLSTRSRRLVSFAALGVALVVVGGVVARRRAEVTFTRDVAPITLQKCAACHRPGEAGPFELLTYEDVADHGDQIVDVTQSRYMPPWKPLRGVAEYTHERGLTDAEIAIFARWVKGGMLRGDPADMPPTPQWPSGWQLGEPDVVLELPEPYVLPRDGRDVYRNFVFKAPIAPGGHGTRWVAGWEFRAGTRASHHAILNVDRLGVARKRDEADPGPGYTSMMDPDVQSPDGFYLVWTPGNVPAPILPGSAWRLDDHTDLVLQVHLQPTGKEELVRPKIGLFFAKTPPDKPRISLRIGDRPIDLAPGERWTMHDELTLPADVDLLGLFPHAHYLARTVRVWATLPDGSDRRLLEIADWDPGWQDEYTFAKPIRLGQGTTLRMEIGYDNTDKSPRNPNKPPKRVRAGEQSTDEMGNVTLQLAPVDPRALLALREAKYRWQLAVTDDGRTRYNLANVLSDEGRIDEAIAAYRVAIERDPALASAHFNLAILLRRSGALDEAIAAYQRAAALQPSCGVLTNLGAALRDKGKKGDATAAFEEAIALDARCASAENSLALLLAQGGDPASAIAHFERALGVEPDNALSHFHLGNALAATGQPADAATHYRRALALRPDFPEATAALAQVANGGPAQK